MTGRPTRPRASLMSTSQIPEVNPDLGDTDTRAELAPHQRPTLFSSGEANKEDQPRGLSRLSEPEEPNLFRVRAETTDTRPRPAEARARRRGARAAAPKVCTASPIWPSSESLDRESAARERRRARSDVGATWTVS